LDTDLIYRISEYDRLSPFLMTVVSDSDHWLFVSSTGALTAGREDVGHCLFPYETVDRLHVSAGIQGPLTLLRVRRGHAREVLWQPFDPDQQEFKVHRNLFKTAISHRVVFEEINESLGLCFRYSWGTGDRFGFIRTCSLQNLKPDAVRVRLLDGVINLLPPAVDHGLQLQMGCLADAYKMAECDSSTGLGIFSLASLVIDRAEPGEALRATTVWSTGLRRFDVLLSTDQVASFRRGQAVRAERLSRGVRGAYLVHAGIGLRSGQTARWRQVADVEQAQAAVTGLRRQLRRPGGLWDALDEDMARVSDNLRRNVATADGMQLVDERMVGAHHRANVLFNNMRGGVFADGYGIEREDFVRSIEERNRTVTLRARPFLRGLPERLTVRQLLEKAQASGDPDLERLAHEYLPLTFSRRHGDPSRPWNRFNIHVKDAQGRRILNYQGNWRDIFQNWETLCRSYPDFLESIIAKFVNASTIDGFNPISINRRGLDWEVAEPGNAFANLGYWGDHQIIYLLKLLEGSHKYSPARLQGMMDRPVFSYARVPYRILPYRRILQDPHHTIEFDDELHRKLHQRAESVGSDAKLWCDRRGRVIHVTLAEKLLVPALSKLSNLVTDGGIWMNTQRPEWNDANNALVGYGVSMVTLYYLRRYLAFCLELLEDGRSYRVGGDVVSWMRQVGAALERGPSTPATREAGERARRRLLDDLGEAFSSYRGKVYRVGPAAGRPVTGALIRGVLRVAIRHLDRSIRANRRKDGLYHAYNLLHAPVDMKTASIETMYEMLEGQVAVLSSGCLDARATLDLLVALPASRLYRPDQHTYMLYPVRTIPGFLERNRIPVAGALRIPLLREMLRRGDTTLVLRDADGRIRFHTEFRNGRVLRNRLEALRGSEWGERVRRDGEKVLELYESIFKHKSFTGRSGVMFAYEGIGCVYWHMVAKLLVAVQESYYRHLGEGTEKRLLKEIGRHYYRIRDGLGFNKSPAEYGAFPTDPYSHTPLYGQPGAKQPGLTGQVKDEILARFGELGVVVESGQLTFRPSLLRRREFLVQSANFRHLALDGRWQEFRVPAGSLAFTVCQVPVVYRLADGEADVEIPGRRVEGLSLPVDASREVFGRSGAVRRIRVTLPPGALLDG